MRAPIKLICHWRQQLYIRHAGWRPCCDLPNQPDCCWLLLGHCEVCGTVAALQISVRSPRLPRLLASFGHAENNAVRSQRKQVAIASQLTRRGVAASMPRAPWQHSNVAQGICSIAVGWLPGHAQIWQNVGQIVLVPISWSLISLLTNDHIQTMTCGVYLHQLLKICIEQWKKLKLVSFLYFENHNTTIICYFQYCPKILFVIHIAIYMKTNNSNLNDIIVNIQDERKRTHLNLKHFYVAKEWSHIYSKTLMVAVWSSYGHHVGGSAQAA